MTKQTRNYITQWAGQFYVAAELTKRGYLISFPLGNAKETDLMIESPNDIHFRIEVKSQSTRNFWRYKKREARDDLFYIFVYLNRIGQNPKFYVLTSKETMGEWDRYFNRTKKADSDPNDSNWVHYSPP